MNVGEKGEDKRSRLERGDYRTQHYRPAYITCHVWEEMSYGGPISSES